MRLVLLGSVAILMVAQNAHGANAVITACPFHDKQEVEVEGVARSVMSGAQEPGESINTYFYLETSGAPCGKQRISVFAPGILPCLEGEKVAVRGRYYKPSEPPFDFPMIDLATINCLTHG